MRCKSLHIALPWAEERLLKRGRTEVRNEDDFVQSLSDRYVKRPSIPFTIDQMTLFEYLTWFDYDSASPIESNDYSEISLQPNPLWRTNFSEPPLLKTSTLLPRIVTSCGKVLVQHKKPTCISFTCQYSDSMLAMFSIMAIGIPYRDRVGEFLGGKQGIH